MKKNNTKLIGKEGYTYVVIKHNDELFSHDSTLLRSKWKKTKYICLFKTMHKDGSESLTHYKCSNNLEAIQKEAKEYVSWYNYPIGLRKDLQGYISEI